MIVVQPLDAPLGAEVSGLDPGHFGAEDARTLRDALIAHAVLVVRDLDLTPDQHVTLTRVFGEPAIHPIEAIRLDGVPEVIDLHAGPPKGFAGDDPRGDEVVAAITWHSDLTYVAEPSRGALLYAVAVPPEGGDTGFVDTARVYEALPADVKKRIAHLEAVHAFAELSVEERAALARRGRGEPGFESVVHPLVHHHPDLGQSVLNISPLFVQAVVGLDPVDSELLLGELRDFATQDAFTYFHQWRAGDLVIWDNWRTMHMATGHHLRHERRMLRTTVAGAPLPTP